MRADVNSGARVGDVELVPFDMAVFEEELAASWDATTAAVAGKHDLTDTGIYGLPTKAAAVGGNTPGTEGLDAVAHNRSEAIGPAKLIFGCPAGKTRGNIVVPAVISGIFSSGQIEISDELLVVV